MPKLNDEYSLGWLAAAADVACRREDVIVEELLRAIGVTKKTHLRKYRLPAYERQQLMAYFWRTSDKCRS